MWFSKKDLIKKSIIPLDDIHGYVLPHASTTFTGGILSHTLRFKPKKKFNSVYIFYTPASKKENVYGRYFHEYYVLFKVMEYVIKEFWQINRPIKFIDVNVTKPSKSLSPDFESSLYIISADFSHFIKPMSFALDLENKAAKSILFKHLSGSKHSVIDNERTFKFVNNLLKAYNLTYQWVGRTRSPGIEAVGYLSFLIRDLPKPNINPPDGMFVTVYDKEFRSKECLGKWYSVGINRWNYSSQQEFVKKVIKKGNENSRLTGGDFKGSLCKYVTITYLYKNKMPYKNFIRGWHGLLANAFYLPDVFLENTFENGKWIVSEDEVYAKYLKGEFIKGDDMWPEFSLNVKFNKTETLNKLKRKSGDKSQPKIELYNCEVLHFNL